MQTCCETLRVQIIHVASYEGYSTFIVCFHGFSRLVACSCVFFGGGTQSHHLIYQYLAVVSGAIRFFPRAVSETPGQWPISFASKFESDSARKKRRPGEDNLHPKLIKLSTLRPFPTPVGDSIFGMERDPQFYRKNVVTKFHLSRRRCVQVDSQDFRLQQLDL